MSNEALAQTGDDETGRELRDTKAGLDDKRRRKDLVVKPLPLDSCGIYPQACEPA